MRLLILAILTGLGGEDSSGDPPVVDDTHHETFWEHLHSPEMIALYGKVAVALIGLAGVIIAARLAYRKIKG